MTTVKDLLKEKEDVENFSVLSSDNVAHALKLMTDSHIGAVFVVEDDKIIGIYTERDYLYRGEVTGRVAAQTAVKEVMTPRMVTITRATTVSQCMGLMKEYRIRHLPVVENNRLIGVISMRDVLETLLRDKESEIHGLENYILASGFES